MRRVWTTSFAVLFASALMPAIVEGGATPGTGHNIVVTAYPVRYPDIAYDAQNDVFLGVTGNSVVQGQFVSPSGAQLPGVFGGRFNVTTSADYQHAARVHCAVGVCLIVWHQGSPVVPMARVVSYTSGFVSQPIAIGPEKSAWEFGAGISFSTATNEFFVTWMGDYPASNNIYMARVNVSGQLLQTTPITTGTAYERQPSVAYNPVSDEFVVAYAGTRFVSGVETGYIRFQRIKNNALHGGATEIYLGGATYIPIAEYNPARQSVAIAWVRGGKTYAREVATDGTVGALTTLSSSYGAYDALDLAYNSHSASFLAVTHGTTAENVAFEVSPTLVPSAAFAATNSGGTGNYNPRLTTSTVEPKWLIATSRSFSSLWVQFAHGTGGGTPPPPPPPSALTVTSFTPNKTFPITVGESVTFTATAAGGTGPYTYRFVTYNSSAGWAITQDYSALSTFTYFPGVGTNAVQVWVRNAGSTADYDAYASSGFFTVNGNLPVITSFGTSTSFPQPVGTAVTFTATVSGGINPQYRFVTYNSTAGWAITQDYGALNTFTYFPGAGTNAVQVWVRNQGSTADYEAYRSSGYFTIGAAAPLVVTSLVSNKTFPQPANTSVTFTASTSGGSGPLTYRFVTYNASVGWTIARDYATSSSFTYTPAPGKNVVQVWVRNNGSVADYDAYLSSGYFTILSPSAPTGVTLTPQQSFPVPYNTPVSFTASAVGGSNVQYQFVTYSQVAGWQITQPYSSWSTFTYYPPAGVNAVQVWVRNAGSTADYEAWTSSGYFTVSP